MTRPQALGILAAACAVVIWWHFARPGNAPFEQISLAPFTARYGDLALSVPRRPDIQNAVASEGYLNMVLCEREAIPKFFDGCKDMRPPLVNQFGLSVVVRPIRPHTMHVLFGESPVSNPTPRAEPLIDIPRDQIPTEVRQSATEAYELSRLAFRPFSVSTYQTTSFGWPIVSCKNSIKGRSCGVGFLLKGAFIEMHFSPENGADPDQRGIWTLAKAVERKLLELAL